MTAWVYAVLANLLVIAVIAWTVRAVRFVYRRMRRPHRS